MESDKQKDNSENNKKKETKISGILILKTIVLVILLCTLGVALYAMYGEFDKKNKTENGNSGVRESSSSSNDDSTPASASVDLKSEKMAEAEKLAVQYDYEGAIRKMDEIPGADTDSDIITKKAEYESAKNSLVPTDPSNITHVFYHSLVVDPQKAFFQNNNETAGFCQWMTTLDEFNKITQQMYDRGYVLVDIHELVEESKDENGVTHVKKKPVMLPQGKTPFVLSLDDVSYYHSYDGRGTASKLVLDDNENPMNEYIQDDGKTVTGAYDCIPLIDAFVEQHPDFSYKGSKGTIALTGYDGILGYRTDIAYKTKDNLSKDQSDWLAAHPDFNWDKECKDAKKVAEAIKAKGWTFASHTWGHIRIGDATMDHLMTDTQKWKQYVEPLIGETDTIIFAHGQDLANWNEDYASTDKFKYLKEQGFSIFCNVDGSKYFVQQGDLFFRMGRRNLDGYRLYQCVYAGSDKLNDLFDPASVWDQRRPTDPALYTIS